MYWNSYCFAGGEELRHWGISMIMVHGSAVSESQCVVVQWDPKNNGHMLCITLQRTRSSD